MGKKILLCCVIVLLMAAVAGPLNVFAEGDPLASPTPRPTQRITVPVISGVNPWVTLPEEDLGDITSSGSFTLQDPFLTGGVAPPSFVDLVPIELNTAPGLPAGDESCGPAALAQALDILSRDNSRQVPDASELEEFLRERELMYTWGTGVEELVFAARSFGYSGARAVHHWRLDELIHELLKGKPLVVPLGINGPDQPGHFVVLTGVSPDGEWIECSDPRLGNFRLSRDEFTSFWELQGQAGVILANALPANTDPMLPWMGLLSTLSALGLVLNQTKERDQAGLYKSLRRKLANPHRKGIGGGITLLKPGWGADWPTSKPQEAAMEVPIYKTRKVQVGLRRVKRVVPVYETRQVQVGFKREECQVPIYKTVKVFSGTRMVDKRIPVTRYRIKKVWAWKKVTIEKPVTLRIGSKRITLWKRQTRWRWVRIDKKVPYQTTKIIKVREPVYINKKVQVGTRTVTRWVPRYKQQRYLAGYKTVEHTEPIYEERRFQVGTHQDTCPALPDQVDTAIPDLVANDGEGDEEPFGEDEPYKDLLVRDTQPVESPATLLQKAMEPEISLELGEEPADSWLYKIILFIQNVKAGIGKVAEKLGAPRDPADPPHLFSLTTQEEAPLNVLTEEGIQVNSFISPHFLDLFFTRQDLVIGPKVVTTVYPDGLMDFNLTSKTWSIKLGDITLFSTLDGEFGVALLAESRLPDYDYQNTKHSFLVNFDGVTYKVKSEGIIVNTEKSNDQAVVKAIQTLVCQITTIRTLGVLVGVVLAVLLAALLYLYFNARIPIPLPT
jgi:predicted double-glycine peptidase